MLRKMKNSLHIFTVLAFILLGCATEEVKIAESQATMKTCCKSFSHMKYDAIPMNIESRVKMNKNSSFYAFEEGRSFFKGYKLPADSKTIIVKSFYSPGDLISGMFRPVITMLDENYKKTRFLSPFVKQSLERDNGSYGYYHIEVHSNEKYFIVHTDDDSYEDSFYHFYDPARITRKGNCIDPRMAAVFGGVIGAVTASNCGNSGKDIPHTVIGEISVKVIE